MNSENTRIEIPTCCPACDYKLELVNQQLFCRNTACDAQIQKKAEQFVKVIGIKGLGPKTIEALDLTDLTELYYLDQSEIASLIGSAKTAEKLFAEIENSKKASLAQVLAAMSIPLVGMTASTKISSVVSHIDEINAETCKLAGLGEKVTNNLLTWLDTEFKETRDFWPFSFESKKSNESASTGKTVCITGKLVTCSTKAEATEQLTAHGYRVVDTISSKTDYLLDEGNKGSSKRQKAEELGITIITNLLDFLGKH